TSITYLAGVGNQGVSALGTVTVGTLAGFSTVLASTDGGVTWPAMPAPPAAYLGGNSAYASSITTYRPNVGGPVFIGGSDSSAGGGYVLSFSGGAWNNITTDAAGNGPHTSILSMTMPDVNDLLVGTDG